MSFWPTIMGAAVGLLIGVFAYYFALPIALRGQVKHGLTEFSTPFGIIDVQQATTLFFRYAMPIFFAIHMAILSNIVMGKGVSP